MPKTKNIHTSKRTVRTARRPIRRSGQRTLHPLHHLHFGLLLVLVVAVFVLTLLSALRPDILYAGPPAAPTGKVWSQVWADEFTGSSVDTSKWNVQNNSNYGGGNKEDQCYQAANVSVAGGSLRLTAQRETVTCGGTNPDTGNTTYYFTSGMVTSRAQGGSMKFKFKQGYAEVRSKSPKGNPYWPAFWLVSPNDGSTPGWPDYGEFDIFEHYGARPDVTNGSLHYKCTGGSGHCQLAPTWYNLKTDSAYGGTSNLGTQITNQTTLDNYSGGTTDFAIYGFLWEANKLSWYVNGRLTRYFDGTNLYRIEQNGSATLENSTASMGTPAIPFSTVFGYEHSINLNLAVGGDGPRYANYGYTGIDTAGGYQNGNYAAVDPGTFEVDYVRVYQLADTPISGGSGSGGTSVSIPVTNAATGNQIISDVASQSPTTTPTQASNSPTVASSVASEMPNNTRNPEATTAATHMQPKVIAVIAAGALTLSAAAAYALAVPRIRTRVLNLFLRFRF